MESKLDFLKEKIKNRFIGYPIKIKLLTLFMLSVFLVVAFFEIFLIYTIKNYYYSGIAGILKSQANYSANLYTTYLSNANLSDVVLNDLSQFYTGVKAQVQILNNSGQVVLDDIDGSQIGLVLEGDDVKNAKDGNIGSYIYKNKTTNINQLSVTVPLNSRTEQVGMARFTVSLEKVDEIMVQRYIVFFFFGIFVLIVSFLFGKMMTNIIVKPLEELTDVALKLSDGRLYEKASEIGDDEIAKLGKTMNLMSENLVKKEQLKKDFISSVSHELRTPLTVIKGWAFTLQSEAKNNKLLEDGLNIIEKESDRLGNMVTELLDFSELSGGRIIMDKELFDLNELGIFINKQLMPKSQSNGIDLLINYDDKSPVMIMADKDRIKQVLINLIDNAIKFTAEGGTVLTNVTKNEENSILEIIDNGCGISEEEIELVTGKFYKGTNSNSNTGLGLSICEEIVNAHNGNLIIKSILGKGTTVRVEIPLEKEFKNEI